jgi:hypothetical protein
MANITEVSNFDANVYLISLSDPVIGGVDGIDNKQAIALANRTRWLKDNLDPLLGKIFLCVSYGTSVTVSTASNKHADNSSYSLAFPIASPDYTTPNDGVTRTYKITMSSFADFTYGASANVQMTLYTTTSGPTYSPLIGLNLRQPYQYIAVTKIITIGPNTKLKVLFSNNATGANATFTDNQLIIEEV